MAQSHNCPKCGGTMTEGFTLDHTHGGARDVSAWVGGKPERSFWVGVKLRGQEPIEIATWRCGRCSFLESYAR